MLAPAIAGIGDQAREALLVPEREGRSQQSLDLRAADVLGHLGERLVARRVRKRSAHRDREPAARRQHAPHLTERQCRIGKEHRCELAHHDIEGAVLERQITGVAVAPFDLGRRRVVPPPACGD